MFGPSVRRALEFGHFQVLPSCEQSTNPGNYVGKEDLSPLSSEGSGSMLKRG